MNEKLCFCAFIRFLFIVRADTFLLQCSHEKDVVQTIRSCNLLLVTTKPLLTIRKVLKISIDKYSMKLLTRFILSIKTRFDQPSYQVF